MLNMHVRILCLLLAVLSCSAQTRSHSAPGSELSFNYVPAVLAQYLSLTDGQIASFNQAIAAAYGQRLSITQSILDLQTQLHKAIAGSMPDPAQIGNLYLQIASQQTALANVSKQLSTQLSAAPSSDQEAKVKALQDAQSLQTAICAAQTAGLLPSIATGPGGGVSALPTILSGVATFSTSCAIAIVPTATMRNGDFSPSPAP